MQKREKRKKNLSVESGPILKSKTKEFVNLLKVPNFEVTDEWWFEAFRMGHGKNS